MYNGQDAVVVEVAWLLILRAIEAFGTLAAPISHACLPSTACMKTPMSSLAAALGLRDPPAILNVSAMDDNLFKLISGLNLAFAP